MNIWYEVIQYLGLLFGVIYVFGAVKEKVWCWPAGLLAITFYGIYAYFQGWYGEVFLQFFYIPFTIFGWVKWSKTKEKKDLAVSRTKIPLLIILLLIGAALSVFFYFVLDAPPKFFEWLPPRTEHWRDSVTTGFSIVATWMVAKKKIENWLIWIVVNIIYATMMFDQASIPFTILYSFYVLFSIYGFIEWRKNLK